MSSRTYRLLKPSRRWRHSLYARAFLFVAVGSGALVGAMAVLSVSLVEDSVERLLEERIDLARTAGVFLEHKLVSDLDLLANRVRTAAMQADGQLEPAPIRSALSTDYGHVAFSEGAFVLDSEGEAVAGVPNDAADVRQVVDMGELVERARSRGGVVSAPLVRVGPRHIVMLLQPFYTPNGELLGFVGGLIHPVATNVLDPVRRVGGRLNTELDLVDRHGVVVASTERRGLFRRGDHGELLATAIRNHDNVQGRCHSCHVEAEGSDARETDVMAFAPLPTLELGLAVRQPEAEALAPAFALQRRLFLLGLSFVALFMVFAGLSVRSVVQPITRLTDAVHRSESSQQRLSVGSFGRDEVGELASALELWRGRMLESLRSAERHQEALNVEIESTRRHLEVLQEIVAQSTVEASLEGIVDHALERSLSLLNLCCGVMGFKRRDRDFFAFRGMSEAHAECLLKAGRESFVERDIAFTPSTSGPFRTAFADLSTRGPTLCCGETYRTVVAATTAGPHDMTITAVLCQEERREVIEERRLSSILRHVGLAATTRLLRESDLERQTLQRLFIRRVLKAQEGERRRVARELHDTLSQDLAALRLEIERLSSSAATPDVRDRLLELESRTHEMLLTVRGILLDLRLSVLESMGFVPALQAQLERVEQDHGIRTAFVIDGEEVELGYDMAVTLFRILQESLSNVVQHAKAEHVFVTVARKPDSVELVVEDDGVGFDPSSIHHRRLEPHTEGLGLLGMEERASLLAGEMTISSSPNEGTTIRISVPLPAEPEPEDVDVREEP